MAAPMEKTKTPGVFKRGNRYVVVFRDGEGRQRKVAARTLAEARKLKGARTADVARGEFHPQSRERFRKYAEAWIERYQGTGRRGFRESTRDDYRRLLHEFAFPFFDERRRRRLSEVTPGDIAEFVGWLCDPKAMADLEHEQALEQARADGKPPPERKRDERPLSDSTVRNILKPVRACFATAVREGRVRYNPTIGATLTHHDRIRDEDGEEVRALTREQLVAFLAIVHPRHRYDGATARLDGSSRLGAARPAMATSTARRLWACGAGAPGDPPWSRRAAEVPLRPSRRAA